MIKTFSITSRNIKTALFAAMLLSGASAMAQTVSVELKGANEVPANTSTATEGKMAHIHTGVAGANGPVIVGLTKNGDNGWTVPAGAKFSDEQYAAYLAGGLYVNVHSAAHPGGEIRGQLLPK